jgi:hypothetical protein
MRRVAILAGMLVLATAAVASAAGYKTGTYSVGNPSTKAAGMTLTIHKGSFSVQAMSFREHCAAHGSSFNDYFEFESGASAQLKGKINGHGGFSGKWSFTGGADKVSGTVKGGKATVKGSEKSTYQPSATSPVYTCAGSATFHATLLQTTGG